MSGTPSVGKGTLIEALGLFLTGDLDKRVAVLALGRQPAWRQDAHGAALS